MVPRNYFLWKRLLQFKFTYSKFKLQRGVYISPRQILQLFGNQLTVERGQLKFRTRATSGTYMIK